MRTGKALSQLFKQVGLFMGVGINRYMGLTVQQDGMGDCTVDSPHKITACI